MKMIKIDLNTFYDGCGKECESVLGEIAIRLIG